MQRGLLQRIEGTRWMYPIQRMGSQIRAERIMRAGIIWFLILMSMAVGVRANAQDSAGAVPKVAEHAAPYYPPLARQTRISGDVRLKVTTDGEAVTNVEVISGHPVLRKAAEDNVRTWKFATNSSPSTFFVTFRYKLTSGSADVEFLEESGVIRLTESPPTVYAYYSNLDMGAWSVKLTSSHGELLRILKMSTTGPGEWLDVKFMDEKDYRKEEKKKQEENEDDEEKDEEKDNKADDDAIDFGHTEKDFVSFAAKLEWRDGKRTMTFFVGKINGDRITGTFVDDAGLTGKWNGVRIKKSGWSQSHSQ
jgi:hypothetical protein